MTTGASDAGHTPLNLKKRGFLVAAIGGTLLSIDIPLIRLAETDPWSTLFVRGPIMFVLFLVFAAIIRRTRGKDLRVYNGKPTLVFGTLHCIATICFVTAIYHTTTANLVFITAFASLFGLVIARVFLAEPHPLVTWIAVLMALSGITLITVDDFVTTDGENTFGNLAALLCALMLALEMLYLRRQEKNLSLAPALSGLMAAIIVIPFVILWGLNVGRPEYLLLNSVLVSPVAMALLALAPRYISAPEATMFFLLETVLAPILVWAIFAEVPTEFTLLGGAIVITAIIGHSLYQIWRD